MSVQNLPGLIDADAGLKDWWSELQNAQGSSEVVGAAVADAAQVPRGSCDSQEPDPLSHDSQDDDSRVQSAKAKVAADVAVFRQQSANFTIFDPKADLADVMHIIGVARGDFKSEMNKQCMGIIIDCDEGPENHSHPESLRHAPKVGKYVSKLLEAAACMLDSQEYLVVFCGANPNNYTRVRAMLAGEGDEAWWLDKRNRKVVADKGLKMADIYVAYNNRGKGDKRIRGALGAGNVEHVVVCSCVDLHRLKKKPRLSRPEQTTHSQFFDGFKRPSWASCDQMAPDLKQEIYSWLSHSIDVRTVTGQLGASKESKHSDSGGKRPYKCVRAAAGKLPYTCFPKAASVIL